MSIIHLIAPSGFCMNQQAARLGVQRLQAAGYQVENQTVITRRHQCFAGTDAERLQDINQLPALPATSHIILAIRGGYGASRLLTHIDYPALAARQRTSPLCLCGHSDFTAIQMALLTHCDLISLSGPMLASNFGETSLDPFTWQHFLQALTGDEFTLQWQSQATACEVQGKLWGGNLTMLCSLIGTPWLPKIQDGILVLEDINEPPYRIERMLLQLYYTGILSRQRAIIFGDFTSSQASYDSGFSLASVRQRLQSLTNIPILDGLPFGHQPQTVTLPIGAQAHLHHRDQHTTLTLSTHNWLAS